MFRRGARGEAIPPEAGSAPAPRAHAGRVTSVLGQGVQMRGRLTGQGGIRIEGAFEGEIAFDGLVIVAEGGRVTAEQVQAKTVVVAGLLKGRIVAERVEIRKTGRVWGDVVTVSLATEEGAFLRGRIQMEEQLPAPPPAAAEGEEEAPS